MHCPHTGKMHTSILRWVFHKSSLFIYFFSWNSLWWLHSRSIMGLMVNWAKICHMPFSKVSVSLGDILKIGVCYTCKTCMIWATVDQIKNLFTDVIGCSGLPFHFSNRALLCVRWLSFHHSASLIRGSWASASSTWESVIFKVSSSIMLVFTCNQILVSKTWGQFCLEQMRIVFLFPEKTTGSNGFLPYPTLGVETWENFSYFGKILKI